jgi:hypothetical protein
MAFKDPLFSAIDMFGGKTEYEPLYYSKPLKQATEDSISQLGVDRAGYNKDIGNIEGEVAGAQALYKDATREDMGNLGKIVNQSAADPRDLFSFLATQFPGMADAMLGKLNAGGLSAVDKIGLSGRGYGGRGNARSRFETILATNRMGQAAIPLFQTAMNSIIPGVTALSNVGSQNARTAMEAIAQRGNIPLRGVGLSFLPMEARGQASNNQADLLGKIGAANVANIFGIDAKDNFARKLGKYGNEQAGQAMDLAKTAASMYFTGGMAGMGGMGGGGGTGGAGGIFSQIFGMQKPTGGGGGGGGGQGGSSPNYTPYIPVAPQAPSFGYSAPQYQGYQPPPSYQGSFGY